jgi:hypothetical protein
LTKTHASVVMKLSAARATMQPLARLGKARFNGLNPSFPMSINMVAPHIDALDFNDSAEA